MFGNKQEQFWKKRGAEELHTALVELAYYTHKGERWIGSRMESALSYQLVEERTPFWGAARGKDSKEFYPGPQDERSANYPRVKWGSGFVIYWGCKKGRTPSPWIVTNTIQIPAGLMRLAKGVLGETFDSNKENHLKALKLTLYDHFLLKWQIPGTTFSLIDATGEPLRLETMSRYDWKDEINMEVDDLRNLYDKTDRQFFADQFWTLTN